MTQPKPLTTKEFDGKFANKGYTFKEEVKSTGKFGEIKYTHVLTVYNKNKEIVYREWYICTD